MAYLIVLLAGALHALAVAWPFPGGVLPQGQAVWWLQMLALALLVWRLRLAVSWQQAGLLGWVFATSMLAGTFWWLFISMHTYGGLQAILAVLAVLGLAAFLGSYYAAACALAGRLFARRRSIAWCAAGFAAVWTAAELARTTWLTGFPWGAGGYAHVDGPLAGWPQWVGVLGTGAIAALLAAALGLWRAWAGAAVAWVILPIVVTTAVLAPPPGISLPWVWDRGAASAGRLPVTLLQGNIPQDEKFQPGSGVPQALEWYGAQLHAVTTPLVVGPETAVPLLPDQLPAGYWASLVQLFSQRERAALLGIPLGSFEAGYTNSVIGLQPNQAVPYQYDKHHLVPFGEFIPPGFRWFTDLMQIPLGDFNRGAVGQPSFAWQGQRLAPNICYEDLFGEELGARFIDPAMAPTIFVNVSNIGWFGDSVAIDQHLLISRMRALEFQRPFVRATNTGATVIIDHRGQVTHALPRLTRGVLVGEVEGRTGTTPYAWWVSRWGLWPLWALSGLVFGLAWWRRR